MVKTSYLAIAMKEPNNVPAIMIDKYIQGKQSSVAVLRGATIQIARTTPVPTMRTGKHCKNNVQTIRQNNINQGCGCWGKLSVIDRCKS